MAETAKPKPRRGSKTQNPAAKSRTRTAAKPEASQEPAAETSAKTAEQTTANDSEHVKIIPPAATKKSSGAWFFSFLLMIVIVGVGHVTWPRWQPYVMAYVPDGLNIAFDDSRVDDLTARIGELESKTVSLRQRDKEIVRLEGEREELQQSLAGVLEHIEFLERSIFAVKEMAKAATTATKTPRTVVLGVCRQLAATAWCRPVRPVTMATTSTPMAAPTPVRSQPAAMASCVPT